MKLPSLPENPHLFDVFGRFRSGMEPLFYLHDAILREESPLSPGERELIAAYVSGLNSCHGAHQHMAAALDVDRAVFAPLMEDVETADVDEKLKPILAYVKKLTLTPSKMTQADVDRVIDAGWTDEALYSAVQVCALFNFMNRIVEGMGVVPSDEPPKPMPKEMAQGNYSRILDAFKDGAVPQVGKKSA